MNGYAMEESIHADFSGYQWHQFETHQDIGQAEITLYTNLQKRNLKMNENLVGNISNGLPDYLMGSFLTRLKNYLRGDEAMMFLQSSVAPTWHRFLCDKHPILRQAPHHRFADDPYWYCEKCKSAETLRLHNEEILYKRTEKWIRESMPTLLESKEPILFLPGCLHLYGHRGMINILRNHDWKVEHYSDFEWPTEVTEDPDRNLLSERLSDRKDFEREALRQESRVTTKSRTTVVGHPSTWSESQLVDWLCSDFAGFENYRQDLVGTLQRWGINGETILAISEELPELCMELIPAKPITRLKLKLTFQKLQKLATETSRWV